MSAKKPLFVFFGTSELSVCVLNSLERRGLLPALIITAPDRPRGRGLELSATPVKLWAQERSIDVLTPATLAEDAVQAALHNSDWDVFVVAMYANLLPQSVLDIPARGVLNVHPSLLPRSRGPSPVLSAILANERATGVTIMQLVKKMDAGPIVAQARIELEEDAGEGGWPPKGSEFEEFLATEGGTLLAEVLPLWLAGQIPAEPQDDALATYTKKFTQDDALIDLEADARTQLLKIRAFDKSPRAHFFLNGKRIIVTEAKIVDDQLVITRIIPEGKKEMAYEDFLRSQGN